MSLIKKFALAAIASAAFVSTTATANLVSDSGFELNNGSWTTNSWGIYNLSSVGRGIHSGLNVMGTGCTDSGFGCTFSQNLNTTAGSTYNINFWLYMDGYADGSATLPNGLQVSFGGVIVDTIINMATTNTSNTSLVPGGPSTLITINNLLATGNLTTLQFAGYHGPAEVFVDDVSVEAATAVPEPASLVLVGLGLAGLGFSRRKKA